MKHQLLKATAAIGFAVSAVCAYAQQGGKGMDMGTMKMDCSKQMGDMKGMKGMDCMDHGSAKATSFTDGEVRNVDTKSGQVTLKHGPIENMKMPPMTMAFPVQDLSVLSGLKEGRKVRFTLENVNGMPTITSLVPQK